MEQVSTSDGKELHVLVDGQSTSANHLTMAQSKGVATEGMAGSPEILAEIDALRQLLAEEVDSVKIDAIKRAEARPNPSRSEAEENVPLRTLKFRVIKKILFPAISLGIFFIDMSTDLASAHRYYLAEKYVEFWLTLSFVLFPAFVIMVMDVAWVCKDYGICCFQEKDQRGKWKPRHIAIAKIRIVLSIVSLGVLGRIWRLKESCWHYMRTITTTGKDRAWHKATARDREKDLAILNLMEAFFESAPQLALQLYISLSEGFLSQHRIWSIASSATSIMWAYSVHYKVTRAVAAGTHDTSWKKMPVYMLAVLAALGARYISFTVCMVYVSMCLPALVTLVHIFVVFLVICCKIKPVLKGMTLCAVDKYLYCILFSFIQFFLFLNLFESNTIRVGKAMLIFYLITHIENIAFAVALVVYASSLWYYSAVTLACVVIHSVFLSCYYKCLHPTVSRSSRR